jgi:hypothetical protein
VNHIQAIPGVHDTHTHTHEHPPDGKIPIREDVSEGARPSDQNLNAECGGTLVL